MTEKKRRRQETLVEAVRKEPFLTDEALAKRLAVSVQTVRLDRTELCAPASAHSRKMRGRRCVPFPTRK